jgi:excisionase family DNA binding protein
MSEIIEDEKFIYTVDEMRQVLGIGRNSAYELVNSNQFPVKHIGKKIVIPIEPFKKWLNS